MSIKRMKLRTHDAQPGSSAAKHRRLFVHLDGGGV